MNVSMCQLERDRENILFSMRGRQRMRERNVKSDRSYKLKKQMERKKQTAGVQLRTIIAAS